MQQWFILRNTAKPYKASLYCSQQQRTLFLRDSEQQQLGKCVSLSINGGKYAFLPLTATPLWCLPAHNSAKWFSWYQHFCVNSRISVRLWKEIKIHCLFFACAKWSRKGPDKEVMQLTMESFTLIGRAQHVKPPLLIHCFLIVAQKPCNFNNPLLGNNQSRMYHGSQRGQRMFEDVCAV